MAPGPGLHPRPDDVSTLRGRTDTLDLSVLICTARRPDSLLRTLTSMAAAHAPRGAWEVVVVDNAPARGEVRAIVDGFRDRLPVRAAREPVPGLSHARNRAVAEAYGRLLVFADDDVTVAPGWLRVYERALAELPHVAVFGGPIVPVFERASPRWVEAIRRYAPTSHAWLEPEGPVRIAPLGEDGIQPFGANFALRADVLSAAPFDPAWGRQPGRPFLGYEEVLLVDALLRAGAEGRWLPDARVDHHMPRGRCTRRYLRDYWYDVGWAEGVLTAEGRSVGAHADAHELARSLRRRQRRWRKVRWTTAPERWVPALRDVARARGRRDGFEGALASRAGATS
ncbi:MAG: glycosyltransferase family 2 protein [Planctomycetota bacterium]